MEMNFIGNNAISTKMTKTRKMELNCIDCDTIDSYSNATNPLIDDEKFVQVSIPLRSNKTGPLFIIVVADCGFIVLSGKG